MEQIYFFDIHCHLIPGVDDGAKDIEESLAALKEEHDQNVRWIICTPHVTANLTSQKAEGPIKKDRLWPRYGTLSRV